MSKQRRMKSEISSLPVTVFFSHTKRKGAIPLHHILWHSSISFSARLTSSGHLSCGSANVRARVKLMSRWQRWECAVRCSIVHPVPDRSSKAYDRLRQSRSCEPKVLSLPQSQTMNSFKSLLVALLLLTRPCTTA